MTSPISLPGTRRELVIDEGFALKELSVRETFERYALGPAPEKMIHMVYGSGYAEITNVTAAVGSKSLEVGSSEDTPEFDFITVVFPPLLPALSTHIEFYLKFNSFASFDAIGISSPSFGWHYWWWVDGSGDILDDTTFYTLQEGVWHHFKITIDRPADLATVIIDESIHEIALSDGWPATDPSSPTFGLFVMVHGGDIVHHLWLDDVFVQVDGISPEETVIESGLVLKEMSVRETFENYPLGPAPDKFITLQDGAGYAKVTNVTAAVGTKSLEIGTSENTPDYDYIKVTFPLQRPVQSHLENHFHIKFSGFANLDLIGISGYPPTSPWHYLWWIRDDGAIFDTTVFYILQAGVWHYFEIVIDRPTDLARITIDGFVHEIALSVGWPHTNPAASLLGIDLLTHGEDAIHHLWLDDVWVGSEVLAPKELVLKAETPFLQRESP